MYKLLVVSVSLIVLFGCGEKTEVNKASGSKGGQAQSHSETAIYLPGGAGIDFGKKPFSDNGGGEGIARSIVFLFSESRESVSSAVDKVMLEQGYIGAAVPHEKYAEHNIYRKDDAKVSFAYNESLKEGFSRETKLLIWYRK
ncbi:hypothetical protein FVE88_12165 [Ectopseudomonas mendocina]|nr:hypothetical protein [Pseudomonas mendocina]TXR38925.1 hypothetical protein FVE88_12165 [Pseudomonas mendocina]